MLSEWQTSFDFAIGSDRWSGETCDASDTRGQQDNHPGHTYQTETEGKIELNHIEACI